MARDPYGKQARLHRIAHIRSIQQSSLVQPGPVANAEVIAIASHPHFEEPQARREVMLVEKYAKLLHPDWHDDAYL